MQYTQNKHLAQAPTWTKIALQRLSKRKAQAIFLKWCIEIFWFGTAGREAILMSQPHRATAEGQHVGSEDLSEILSSDPQNTLKLLQNNHPEGGAKKVFKNDWRINKFVWVNRTAGHLPSSCLNFIWPHPKPNMKDQMRYNARRRNTYPDPQK